MSQVGLEVGCGAAWVPDGGFAVGLDVDIAQLRSAPGVVVCGDARHLPLAVGSTDRIVLRAVLHHLDPIDEALGELSRVAAPGALLMIVDAVALPPEQARRMNEQLEAAGRSPEPLAGLDPDDVAASLGRHGFDVDSIRLDGTATLATRPIVSEDHVTDRFVLQATRRERAGQPRRPSSTAK